MIVPIIYLFTLLINGVPSQICGPGVGNCSREQCCSSSGYCGFTTPEHCGIGCQSDYGRCFNRLPSEITMSGQRCRERGLRCPRGECCSKYENCGLTDEHCGSGCLQGFGSCTLRKDRCAWPEVSSTNFLPPVTTTEGAVRGDYYFTSRSVDGISQPRTCRSGSWQPCFSLSSRDTSPTFLHRPKVGANDSVFFDEDLSSCRSLKGNFSHSVKISLPFKAWAQLLLIRITFARGGNYKLSVSREERNGFKVSNARFCHLTTDYLYNQSAVFNCTDQLINLTRQEPLNENYFSVNFFSEANVCEIEIVLKDDNAGLSASFLPGTWIIVAVVASFLVILIIIIVIVCCRRRRARPFFSSVLRRTVNQSRKSERLSNAEHIYQSIYEMVFRNNPRNSTTAIVNDNYEQPITLRNIPNESVAKVTESEYSYVGPATLDRPLKPTPAAATLENDYLAPITLNDHLQGPHYQNVTPQFRLPPLPPRPTDGSSKN